MVKRGQKCQKKGPKIGQKMGPFLAKKRVQKRVQKWVQKWPKNGSIFGPLLEKPEIFRPQKCAFLINFFRSIFGPKPQVAT